jgi:hypothetical protein
LKTAALLVLIAGLLGCSTDVSPPSLYEKYVGQMLRYYDALLVDREAYARGRSYHRQLVDAVNGDQAAAHQLFHSEYRNQPGEFGETWGSHCFVLLLKLGDHRFASLLAAEDKKTRELVGAEIDAWIHRFAHDFPETRAVYRTRHMATRP